MRAGLDRRLEVVILTLNEERDLPRCLAAIPEDVPVTVLDSGSTDGTVALAQARGCRIQYNAWPGFAPQRNVALAAPELTADWVLFIDADDVFPPEFWVWLERTLPADGADDGADGGPDFDVGMIDSRLILDGTLLRHAPGYPLYHPRLVRRQPDVFVVGNGGYKETVRSDLRIAEIDIPYLHHWHDGPSGPWMHKHLRIAETEVAAERGAEAGGYRTRRARLNRLPLPGPLRVVARFLYHYVVRGGFRDGRAGFRFSLMYAWYEMTKWLMRTR